MEGNWGLGNQLIKGVEVTDNWEKKKKEEEEHTDAVRVYRWHQGSKILDW